MSVAFLLYVEKYNKDVWQLLIVFLKLLFLYYIILLLCEVIKIRMTSDTPVIIFEETNILCL